MSTDVKRVLPRKSTTAFTADAVSGHVDLTSLAELGVEETNRKYELRGA